MGTIYIASKQVTASEIGDTANWEHLYLVYAPHDVVDADALVIRGGPIESMGWSGPFEADHGNIFIDAGRRLVDSDDNFFDTTEETPGTQNFTELKLPAGQTHEAVWANLVAYAKSMGSYNPATQRVETPLDYAILGPNSNGTIAAILSGGAGINVHDTLPKKWGPGGTTIPAETFPGIEDFYLTGAGAKTITIADSHTKTFYDAGTGDTTVVLDATKIRAGGVTLFSDALSGTFDKLVLKGIDPSNLLFWTYNGSDLWIQDRQGHVLAKLMGQLDTANKYNGLEIQKADGTIVSVGLPQKEQDIAPWDPLVPLDNLPSWLMPAVGMHGGRGMVNFGSPLILDLDGDGAHSTKLGWGSDRSTVYFDMDNDGFAERTAWVSRTDGLLALDKNGNGKIDGQGELFGNSTTYADGFASLKTLDSNADNKITSADAQFANLRVWVDADSDGQTDAGELKTLAALGITQINLAATALSNTYDRENLVSAKSSFIIGGQSREIADHWFRFGQEDSRYMGDVTLDVRTLFLPTLKGFGNLKDLHVAMSQDATLLGLVQNFTAGFETKNFLNGAALDAEIKSILFRWAGVDGFSDSDTTFGYNAKINGFLDKITGQKSGWLEGMSAGQTVSSTVISTQTIVFNNLFNNLKTMLVSQTAAGAALLDGLRYDLASGDFQGAPVLSTQGLAKIASDTASLNTSDKNSYWNQLNTYLLHVKPVEDFTAAEVSGLNAIWPMIGGVTWENYAYFYYGSSGYIMTTGATNLSVMLVGDLGADTISGGNGDDYLYGGGSNDTLRGGEGNDHLFGEAGNDYLVGGAGSDIYTYGGGQDTISEEASGTDVIVFGEEYKNAVVTFARPMDALSALDIKVDGVQAIRIENQFSSIDRRIETVFLGNGTQINLSLALNVVGTSGNDTLSGLDLPFLKDDQLIGGSGNDTLNGLLGNDVLEGETGDDRLDGGAGNDRLLGGDGNDTYVYAAGGGQCMDTILDYGGTSDTIVLGAGYTAANVTIERSGRYDMIVKASGQQILFIENQFSSPSSNIETLKYGDGTTTNLGLVSFTVNGTESADTLYGVSYGAGGDIIYGLGGNDYIESGDGNDQIYGGTANDYILAGSGDDIVSGGAGNDTVSSGDGNDTILYEGGLDIFSDSKGTETITITNPAITAANLTLQRSSANNYDLSILIGGSLAFTLQSQFAANSSFESIRFASGTILNLMTVQYTTNGTAGNDYVYGIGSGGNPDDILNGLAGNDYLYGLAGNDTIDGGTGNDVLYGGDGNDTYKINLGSGIDQIWDDSGIDKIVFGAGYAQANMTMGRDMVNANDLNILFGGVLAVVVKNHFYYGATGNLETLQFSDATSFSISNMTFAQSGSTGSDSLNGHEGRDSLAGMDGSDSLKGYAGDDTLTGGTGNDSLSGDAGSDTYKFTIGDGVDTIYDQSGTADTVLMGAGITASNVRFERSGADLNVYYGTSDKVTLSSQFYDDINATSYYDEVETLKFADGSTINLKSGLTFTGTAAADSVAGTSLADTLVGMAGNDGFSGYGGDDVLIGGTGNDTLSGGAGSDTYKFAIGDGVDIIYEETGAADIVLMGAGITAANIRFEKSSYDLNIYYGTSDKITLYSQFYDDMRGSSSCDEVETLKFADGSTINLKSGLTFTGTAAADSVAGTSLADTLVGMAGNDGFSGYGGDDVLIGGTGNDTLSGGAGSDTYKFAIGDGVDIIYEETGAADIVLMGAGITAANIRFEKSSYDLNIYYGTSDKITLYSQFYDDMRGSSSCDEVETLKFADGSTINLKSGLTFTGTAAADSVAGTSLADTLVGMAGNDGFSGYAGDDVLIGGDGNDYIDGGAGVDTASYAGTSSGVTVSLLTTAAQNTVGAGTDTLTGIENLLGSSYNDTLTGDANANTIEGGLGNDTLNGGAGVDTVSYSKATAAVMVDLSLATAQNTGGAGSDLLSNFENIFGSAFADTLKGNASANVINGGAGNDVLYGGLGADSFKFDLSAVGNIDTVKDFKLAEADKLDIRDLLVGYDPLTKAITDFVECTTSGANTIVKVDRDGAGATYGWQQIAVLENAIGLTDEAALKASGTLIP